VARRASDRAADPERGRTTAEGIRQLIHAEGLPWTWIRRRRFPARTRSHRRRPATSKSATGARSPLLPRGATPPRTTRTSPARTSTRAPRGTSTRSRKRSSRSTGALRAVRHGAQRAHRQSLVSLDNRFDLPWSLGCRAIRPALRASATSSPSSRAADRTGAVIMADHYDTAYMEDAYDTARGGKLVAGRRGRRR